MVNHDVHDGLTGGELTRLFLLLSLLSSNPFLEARGATVFDNLELVLGLTSDGR